jgi:hypothetical protein
MSAAGLVFEDDDESSYAHTPRFGSRRGTLDPGRSLAEDLG